MRFVLIMAAREMRASFRRLLFFFICIAVGVGAIVALRSVIQSVRYTFAGEARSLIAADAIITSNQPLKPDALAQIANRLKAAGADSTRSVELATMARPADRADGRARMVELRAVEAGFPYYGRMKLADGVPYQHGLLRGFGALVRPELLAQLNVAVGDGLTIGSQRFTIRGVIEGEPGRRLGAFSIGPRVFVDLADLEKTGLTGYGSRTAMQRLLKVPPAAFDQLILDLRADLSNDFARVRSYKATEDDIGEDFTRAENYLSLVGLVIVILGGIGVSSVTRVFVQQKMKSIAVLKCVGARSLATAGGLCGAGGRARPCRQRARRGPRGAGHARRFRRCSRARRRASRLVTGSRCRPCCRDSASGCSCRCCSRWCRCSTFAT